MALRKIYISAMHSGQNPCAGVGIARSLRKAFQEATLVGVDHWQGSSGLHDPSIDEVLLLPQWKQIADSRHGAQIHALLERGHLWISGMDMEVRWLAEQLGEHPGLLAPGATALELTEKPEVKALEGFGFAVPEHIPASVPDSEAHAFLRHANWKCWLKSPYHDARRISSWAGYERARKSLRKSWRTPRLFLQKHVSGNEESIAFAAYQGELVAAIRLEKRLLTGEGKTWAGQVGPPDPETLAAFREFVRRTKWSGGGELEYVRDPDGRRWIIECNPRFPAWIYGAALVGFNLPAQLVAAAWNIPFVDTLSRYSCFTRVVQEIPARERIGLPLPPDPSSIEWPIDGKKGKGETTAPASFPSLSDSLDEDELKHESLSDQRPEEPPAELSSEIDELTHSPPLETPARMSLARWSEARFSALSRAVRGAGIRVAYSVKTSPTSEHLLRAKHHGFLAECISQLEVRRALESGFRPDEIILNGPGKFWPETRPPERGLRLVFADSVEEFERALAIPGLASGLGFRLRIPRLQSRFGNPLEEFGDFRRIVECARKLAGKSELGFHFHMASWSIGMERWLDGFESLLIWCQAVERLSGVAATHLDLGGGFFPQDLESLDLPRLRQAVSRALPKVRSLYLEPGRALTQDTEVLVSRILDVRRNHEGELLEAVLDASIAELPLAHAYSHRVFYRARSGQRCQPLAKGRARLLGRICMEDDILGQAVSLPDSSQPGDLVIFGDAGAYERTMSYEFGRG